MRFLVANNPSVELPDALIRLDHDAVQVRDLGLNRASDADVMDFAQRERRVVISADRDFGSLLAELKATQPTVFHLRGRLPRDPERLASLLDPNLPQLEPRLSEGFIAVIEPGRIRVRPLPID